MSNEVRWMRDIFISLVRWQTAFCVASDADTSFWITTGSTPDFTMAADHWAIRLPGSDTDAPASVRFRDQSSSLELVSVDLGGIPALHISAAAPLVLQPIAIAGFGAPVGDGAAVSGANLASSVHLGAVVAIGAQVRFDAVLEQGFDGAPLFDPKGGEVLGVVSDSGSAASYHGGLAVPASVLRTFLTEAKAMPALVSIASH